MLPGLLRKELTPIFPKLQRRGVSGLHLEKMTWKFTKCFLLVSGDPFIPPSLPSPFSSSPRIIFHCATCWCEHGGENQRPVLRWRVCQQRCTGFNSWRESHGSFTQVGLWKVTLMLPSRARKTVTVFPLPPFTGSEHASSSEWADS